MPERRVKLFHNGRNQTVRIPREFEMPGEDAIMRKDGVRLIIEPVPPKSLLALLHFVKSMGGEQLEETPMTAAGVLGDQTYALLETGTGTVVSRCLRVVETSGLIRVGDEVALHVSVESSS
jgi:virulence-associated protein VagC